MQPSEKTFLELVRLGIGHRANVTSNQISWQEIYNLATEHGLLAVVIDGIERLPNEKRPRQELLLKWIGEVLQGYEYPYEQYENAIAKLAGFYNSHGFRMMVLKGYACSLDWPIPSHRPCGDIDIWQFGKQREADETLRQAQGPEFKIDKSHHHHTVFDWCEFSVENHYDFVNVHVRRSSAEMEKVFKELGKDDSYSVVVKGEKVYFPSPNLHALFLIKHNVSHFVGAYISLRQVLDWAFFVKNHTKEIDWQWLNSMIDHFHMRDFVNSINAICVEDLGFEASMFKSVQFEPHLKDRILMDVLEPNFASGEPKNLFSRMVYKYKRWKGNGWKQVLCYNESRWLSFWTGLWAKLLKPASI